MIDCLGGLSVAWWALKELGVEEWLVEVGQLMHRNAQSRDRVNGTLSDDFLVHTGLHQGSVLSPLSFTVLEPLS